MIIVLLLGNGVVIENLEENSMVIFILNSFLFYGWDEFCLENNRSFLGKFYFICIIDKYYFGMWNYSQIVSYILLGNVKYGFDIECLEGVNILF